MCKLRVTFQLVHKWLGNSTVVSVNVQLGVNKTHDLHLSLRSRVRFASRADLKKELQLLDRPRQKCVWQHCHAGVGCVGPEVRLL